MKGVVVLLGLSSSCAWAQDETTPSAMTAQLLVPEVSATSLPRFEPDAGPRASRIDMTWLPARRSALGLSLGMTSVDGLGLVSPATAGAWQSVDLGLHWRYTMDSNYRLDVKAWRRTAPTDALSLLHMREPSYGARVEMKIGRAPIKPGFVAERGFVGFQMESGARVTLRRSGGKPMVYYRTNF